MQSVYARADDLIGVGDTVSRPVCTSKYGSIEIHPAEQGPVCGPVNTCIFVLSRCGKYWVDSLQFRLDIIEQVSPCNLFWQESAGQISFGSEWHVTVFIHRAVVKVSA